MYLLWNFDISQESSAYPHFMELRRKKKPKYILGDIHHHWKMHMDPLQVRYQVDPSHQKWTTRAELHNKAIIAAGSPMISCTFPGPSLQWSTSPVQRRRKKGQVVICGAVVKMGRPKFYENLSYIIIHTVAFACFYHIYVYNLYCICTFHIIHHIVRSVFAQIFGKNLSSELQNKPWIDALAPTAGQWS